MNVVPDQTICGACDRPITGLLLANGVIDTFGLDGQPLFHVNALGQVHMHNMAIGARDALTVRGSLRRWSHHANRRLRWKVGGPVRSYRRLRSDISRLVDGDMGVRSFVEGRFSPG